MLSRSAVLHPSGHVYAALQSADRYLCSKDFYRLSKSKLILCHVVGMRPILRAFCFNLVTSFRIDKCILPFGKPGKGGFFCLL